MQPFTKSGLRLEKLFTKLKKSEKIVKKLLTLSFLFDILTMQLGNNTQKRKNDL